MPKPADLSVTGLRPRHRLTGRPRLSSDTCRSRTCAPVGSQRRTQRRRALRAARSPRSSETARLGRIVGRSLASGRRARPGAQARGSAPVSARCRPCSNVARAPGRSARRSRAPVARLVNRRAAAGEALPPRARARGRRPLCTRPRAEGGQRRPQPLPRRRLRRNRGRGGCPRGSLLYHREKELFLRKLRGEEDAPLRAARRKDGRRWRR
jgi:hypothetical protein